MKSRTSGFAGRYIVVADEDKAVVTFVIETLLEDGHAVFQAYDGLSAVQLAHGLKICDLVISNTRGGGRGRDRPDPRASQVPAEAFDSLPRQPGTLHAGAGGSASQWCANSARAVQRRGAARRRPPLAPTALGSELGWP